MDILPPGSRLAVVRSQLAPSSGSEGSSTPPLNDKEPFPDYNEADCDNLASEVAAEKHNDEAWNLALGRAVRDEIREIQVDPNIIPYDDKLTTERSQSALTRMKEILSQPQMRMKTRDQFLTLSNMTLEVNLIIFHHSSEFLAPNEISKAKALTETILTHFAWMDTMLADLCQTVNYTVSVLGQIENEDLDVYTKLCQMARIVAKNLRKPRSLERKLLGQFLTLYEEWVHTPFLRLRNRQILNEQTSCPARAELSRQIIAIWDVVSRCIESYETYIWATMNIREEFFVPTMEALNGAPELWDKYWRNNMGKNTGPSEADPRGCDASQCE
ncbi:hypothetical protein MYU51_002677 [Penicillium brevicompactum]|uniref:uncharacterized protein n=1 Tax=Penicillium brevicompactum TaxID=5074 RepID=UPI00254157AF|nr:uncharacterized protein N7506_011113 [Penicillium brevicompactum]KAJ5321983.1 hypothetical protein N7506_011113 [Penicillium brevicompactum]